MQAPPPSVSCSAEASFPVLALTAFSLEIKLFVHVLHLPYWILSSLVTGLVFDSSLNLLQCPAQHINVPMNLTHNHSPLCVCICIHVFTCVCVYGCAYL